MPLNVDKFLQNNKWRGKGATDDQKTFFFIELCSNHVQSCDYCTRCPLQPSCSWATLCSAEMNLPEAGGENVGTTLPAEESPKSTQTAASTKNR